MRNLQRDQVGISPLQYSNSIKIDSVRKAETLNDQFQFIFTKEDLVNMPSKGESPYICTPYMNVSCKGIKNLLYNLRINKAPGPDRIPVRILNEYFNEIAPILQFIFNLSFHRGELPNDWQTAEICAILKNGDTSLPINNRPISLTSLCGKLVEHVLCHSTMEHQDKNSNSRRGFSVTAPRLWNGLVDGVSP